MIVSEEPLKFIQAVRIRMRIQRILLWFSHGLIAGGSICLFAAVHRLMGLSADLAVMLIVLGSACGAGVLFGLSQKPSLFDAAAMIDARCGLKDRTTTMLQFLTNGSNAPMHQLAVQDAAQHLAAFGAADVAPLGFPGHIRWSGSITVLAFVSLLIPVPDKAVAAVIGPSESYSAIAAQISDDLTELDRMADTTDSEELHRLVAELRVRRQKLHDDDKDIRSALATLSDMQALMAQQHAEFNVEATETQLQTLAQAMSTAPPLKSASEALKNRDYDAAAEALNKVDDAKMDRAESRSSAEKLSELADVMKTQGLKRLQEPVSELADAIEEQDADKLSKASEDLAREVRRHAAAKAMALMLKNKSQSLSELKALSRSGSGSKSGQGQTVDQQKTSEQSQTASRSNKGSRNAGSEQAGDMDGAKTNLESQRQLARLGGLRGTEGESDYESVDSADGEGQVQRRAVQTFAKYRKLSEAVLESEPIPLGQRQTIRNYFESIRPVQSGPSDSSVSP